MPQFMKGRAIELLYGGLENYCLALYGLALPYNRSPRYPDTRYAPIMGLLGASTELLCKACLVQSFGVSAMYKKGDRTQSVYKFGSDCIDELRRAVKNNDKQCEFLWDIDNKEDQQSQILGYLQKFKILQVMRANGLHAGRGCSRDIAVASANDVYGFIQLLQRGKRLKPYLKLAVAPEPMVRDREAIIEDLSRRLDGQKDNEDKLDTLRGMYLVLPYIPDHEPEWLSLLERADVLPPSKEDVSYLIKSLNEAHSISLLKLRGGKEGLPVRIEPNNPGALPISIQNIKRKLSSIPDMFRNDALTANTRLDEGRLDLPIEDFLVDLFALNLENAGIIGADNKLTAESAWAFIVSAYSAAGTPRPCWDIIINCDEPDKLLTYIRKAKELGNGYFKNRADILIHWIDDYRHHRPFSFSQAYRSKQNRALEEATKYTEGYEEFELAPQTIKARRLSPAVATLVHDCLLDKDNIGVYIEKILACQDLTVDDRSIVAMLMKKCTRYEQRNGIVAILRSEQMKSCRSEARKRMFFMDIRHAQNIALDNKTGE